MKQTEEIKAMIRGMMAQEMENFKEAVRFSGQHIYIVQKSGLEL